MKKYIMITTVLILFSSCSKNLSGKTYNVLPIDIMMKALLTTTHKHIVYNFTTDNEFQLITYDENEEIVGIEKKNYRIDGSFLYLDDLKLEIRRSENTIDLYNGPDFYMRLAPR